MKKPVICLAILVAILFVVSVKSIKKKWYLEKKLFNMSHGFSWSAEDPTEIESLSGLEALYINIIISGRAKVPALKEEHLKTIIESKLKQTGITILSKEECLATTDKPFINLILSCRQRYRGEDDIDYHYYLNLQSGQSVRPARFVLKPELSDLEYDLITWRHKIDGKCNRDIAIESIQNATQELVDRFLDDYLTANPKKVKKDNLANEGT
jgi:hypothetical protein